MPLALPRTFQSKRATTLSPTSNSSLRTTSSCPSHDSFSPSYQLLMAARPLNGPASIHDGSVTSSASPWNRSANASRSARFQASNQLRITARSSSDIGWCIPRSAPLVHVRRPDVVAHDGAEEHGIEAVECAAMGPEQGARVLRAGLALDERLEQIADGSDERHAEAEHERMRGGQPVLVAAGGPHAQHRAG